MKVEKCLVHLAVAAFVGSFIAGCATMSPEERRAKYQEEFTQFAAMPPAQMVVSPDPAIANCARLSCDLFNEVHPMMKAYVAKVETSREYTAFMNEVRYCVEEEKMSNQDACKKVYDAVIAADANRPDGEKLWPKIYQGIVAANELEPKKQLAQIAVLSARNLEIGKSVKRLSFSFKGGDFMAKAQRASECAAITKQLADVTMCLAYLGDQYSRVIEIENYAR